jgi:hypothetical protein
MSAPQTGPWLQSARRGALPHVVGREADWASTWWPGPAEEAVHGSRVAGRRQGAPEEH